MERSRAALRVTASRLAAVLVLTVLVTTVVATGLIATGGAASAQRAEDQLRERGVVATAGSTRVDLVVPRSESGRTLGSDAFDVRLDDAVFGATVRRLTAGPLTVDLAFDVPSDPVALGALQGAATEFVLGLPPTVGLRLVGGASLQDEALDRRAALDAVRSIGSMGGPGLADALASIAPAGPVGTEGPRHVTVVVAGEPPSTLDAAVATGAIDGALTWVIDSRTADLLGEFDKVLSDIAGGYAITLPGATAGSTVTIRLVTPNGSWGLTAMVPQAGSAPRPSGSPEVLSPVAAPASTVTAAGSGGRRSVALAVAGLLALVTVGALLVGRSRGSDGPIADRRPDEHELDAERSLLELAATRASLDHPMPPALVLALEAAASAAIDDRRVTVDDAVTWLDPGEGDPAPIVASNAHVLEALTGPHSAAAWDRSLRAATNFAPDGTVAANEPTSGPTSLFDAVTAIAGIEERSAGSAGRSLLATCPMRSGILDGALVVSPSLGVRDDTSAPPDAVCRDLVGVLLDAIADGARRTSRAERAHDGLPVAARRQLRSVLDAVLPAWDDPFVGPPGSTPAGPEQPIDLSTARPVHAST